MNNLSDILKPRVRTIARGLRTAQLVFYYDVASLVVGCELTELNFI